VRGIALSGSYSGQPVCATCMLRNGQNVPVHGSRVTKVQSGAPAVKVLTSYFGRCGRRAEHRDTTSTRCSGPPRAWSRFHSTRGLLLVRRPPLTSAEHLHIHLT